MRQHLTKILSGTMALAMVLSLVAVTRVEAAGSVNITVEPSVNSVVNGGTVVLRFYATPSGANVYGVQTDVQLTNLAFASYEPTDTDFGGFSGVLSGGTPGSTDFQIVASYLGASAGSSTKAYIGRVIATATGEGTATIHFSGAQGVDNTGDPMAASATNRSMTVTAPPSPSPPPPPPSPPSAPAGTTAGSRSNPVSQPNPDSNVAVPNASDPNGEPQIISEVALAEASDQTAQATAAENDGTKPAKSSSNRNLAIGGAVGLALLLMALAAWGVARKRRMANGLYPSMNANMRPPISGSSASNQHPPSHVIQPTNPQYNSDEDHNNPLKYWKK